MLYWGLFIIISTWSMLIYRYNFVTKLALKNYINIAKKYSDEVINMSFPTYLDKEVWSIYKIFDRWIESQFEFFFFFFIDLIRSWTWILFVVILLFYYDPIMALITFSLLPVMTVLGLVFYKKLYPIQKKLDKEWESVYHDLWNSMSVFSLVKTLTIEKIFSNKIKSKLDNCYNKQINISKWWTIADVYTSLFTTISRFFVLWAWVYFIINWKIEFSTLFLFFAYIWWVYFPLWALFWKLSSVQRWITASWKFYSEFDNLENEHANNKWVKKDLKWWIEFSWVNFAYNKKKIIKNLSFVVKSWEKIAFVWDTWAWKSTIINLLLRFWELKHGEILIDDTNINKFNLKYFRKQIWVISQDSSLFNLTIKENLLFANQNATLNEIWEALKKAEAIFLFDLENWIDTLIWERWLKLSWWEKQRLAIARLFLKNPKILILDEATSALDNKTEKKVQIALEKLMKGRTTIIIAHRLTTIKNVDKIFIMKNWEIIESW
jgi:ABC-type multidrug transport system fused ATPase/permease subunit